MKVSINSIKGMNRRYGCADDIVPNGVDDLVARINAQLGGVEETIDVGSKYNGVLVVKVVSCEDHPDADRLHVCKIDDGGKAEGVERDEHGLVQVVCGAPNVRAGMLVAWLAPGVTVPETYGQDDSFVLGARPLRGVVSNGMLASPRELAIGDSHDGILEVDKDVEPGTLFADAYELTGDVVIDIENKMFTHRPDCFGSLGVSRELAGIQGMPFKSPAWYITHPEIPAVEADELSLNFRNELPDLVPRFTAITMRGVEIKPSPVWLQIELANLGMRSINNIVDYTNFFMLETGQPLHAYDYDKVRAQDSADAATIAVRHPHEGEKITLLNGKEIEPRAEAIMIATDKKLIGVGGVMGGADTEVDGNTKNIIIEVANFDMYSIRRTSMAHGLFTDAVTRFNKGQSPLQNLAVLARIVDEIQKFAGGKVASAVLDDQHLQSGALERGSLHEPVRVSRLFITERLGLDVSADDMAALLRNVEFEVTIDGENLTVQAPFWRTDIELPEDIVEEVGRLYGFDKLPLSLPRRDLTPVPKNSDITFEASVRDILARAGANEALTYSFIHRNLLDKAGQNPENAFQLSNALSPDLQYYRLSILPSLLDKVHANIKGGYDEFALFEIGKTHEVGLADDDGTPSEFNNLALVYAARKNDKAGAAYYEARRFLTTLANELGVELVFMPFRDGTSESAPFAEGRSAIVGIKGSDYGFGIVGEFRPDVRKAFKLPEKSAGFEIGYGPLMNGTGASYTPMPRFPKVEQDICLKVESEITYAEIFDLAWTSLQGQEPDTMLCTLTPIDIYQREDDPAHKQITLRLSIASYERTLTDEEVAKLLDHITEAAAEKFQAERV